MGRVVVDVSGFPGSGLRALAVEGRELLLCRAEGGWYVLENRCPHAGVPLSGGRLDGCLLECPFHGGKLDVRDGSPQAPPIRRRATTFDVRAVPDGVEIELGA